MPTFIFLWLQLFSGVCRASTGSPPRKNYFVSCFLSLLFLASVGLLVIPELKLLIVWDWALWTGNTKKERKKKKPCKTHFTYFRLTFSELFLSDTLLLLSPGWNQHSTLHPFAHVISFFQLLFRALEPFETHDALWGEAPSRYPVMSGEQRHLYPQAPTW